MPLTYDPIATYTFASSGTTYTFSSIPGTYTDLVFILHLNAGANPGYGIAMEVNGDTGTNYNFNYMFGSGTATFANTKSNQNFFTPSYGTGLGTATPSIFKIQIQDYSNTTTFKTFFSEAANYDTSYGGVENVTGVWRSTSAITSITVRAPYGSMTFDTGSTMTLYGIKAA